MDAYESAQFVFGSPNRLPVLRALQRSPDRPRGVAERVDVSRATAQRCLRACADRGWVERTDGDYALTPVGRRVVDRCTEFVDELDAIEANEALLSRLPTTDPPFPIAGLDGADVVTATPENPHRAARALADRVREGDAEHYDCLAPTMTRLYIDAFAARLEDGASVELVCPVAVIDAEREVRPENVERSLARDDFSLYVSERDVDHAIVLADERVFIGARDDTQTMAVGVWTSDPAVREWARKRYERERAAAQSIAKSAYTE